MIEFDNGQHMAMVQLSLNGVSVNLNLDLRNIKSEALLKDSRLGELDPRRLKALLEYVDHGFRLDPKSAVPWKEQFCRKLLKECDTLLRLPVTLTPEQLEALRKEVNGVNLSLVNAAKKLPDDYRAAVKLTAVYHDGFNHLTRDDDFIALRAGGRIVSIIPLPGNDFNELKKFLKAGGDRVLSPENVAKFKEAVAEAKRQNTMELLNRKVERKPFSGLKITRE